MQISNTTIDLLITTKCFVFFVYLGKTRKVFDSSVCGPVNIDNDERRNLLRGRAIIHFISVLIVLRVNMSDDRI